MHFHVDPRTKERERVKGEKGVQGKKKSLDCSSSLELLTSWSHPTVGLSFQDNLPGGKEI